MVSRRPFSQPAFDVGPEREVSWSEHGSCEVPNDLYLAVCGACRHSPSSEFPYRDANHAVKQEEH